jgi:Ca2+-binding EF-hand superfamily protein
MEMTTYYTNYSSILVVFISFLCSPMSLAFAPLPFHHPHYPATTLLLPTAPSLVVLKAEVDAFSSSMDIAKLNTAEQEQHARQVFDTVDKDGSGSIDSFEMGDMLRMLHIEAARDEVDALFKYLDKDGNGVIDFEEFLPWYSEAAQAVKEVSESFQSILLGRRTVDKFDQTRVDDSVLRRAVECAITAAPMNSADDEPWRFIQIGPKAVEKMAQLNTKLRMETESADHVVVDWTKIPGWCVVATKLNDSTGEMELEDLKSTSCAVQNFMLSMWSEGIGSKWTSGPVQTSQEFADLCGVDTTKERVSGCIWYGFPSGGLINSDPKRRLKKVVDVLSSIP